MLQVLCTERRESDGFFMLCRQNRDRLREAFNQVGSQHQNIFVSTPSDSIWSQGVVEPTTQLVEQKDHIPGARTFHGPTALFGSV